MKMVMDLGLLFRQYLIQQMGVLVGPLSIHFSIDLSLDL